METATIELLKILDIKLIELLKSLSEEEWNNQTIAKHWKVKDVASHLLDGNLRGLSSSRDNYFGEQAENINSYQDLVSFLNKLNMDWTTATKRLSPKILIELLSLTGQQYTDHLQELTPNANAIYSVAWAGQETSQNWFHIAREYTEKFLHQQQIRDAINREGIMTKELFNPFIDIFMYALPQTFKDSTVDIGTTVSVIITTDIGGQWNVQKTEHGWNLSKGKIHNSDTKASLDPDTAWKLFSKSWTPEQVVDRVEIIGNATLGKKALQMVSVMA